MVHDDMLEAIPSKLPHLGCVELVKCDDLHVQHVSKLVDSRAANKRIVLQDCKHVSARDCMLLSHRAENSVDVDLR